MKKNITLLIFVFLMSIGKAQDIIVADAENRTPIPFVTVKLDETGLYTNEKGIFRTDLSKSKSLELHHLGYKTLKVNTVDIQDTLFMKPEATLLNEIVINIKGENSIQLKPLRSSRKFKSYILAMAWENVIVLHPNKEILDFFVDEVTIPFNKRNKSTKQDYLEGTKAFVRINIYEVENNMPSKQTYSSNPIEIHAQDKDEIKLDLSDLFIKLSEKGVSFGIEFLGFYDDNDNLIKSDDGTRQYIRTSLTEKASKSYTATTYIKNIFREEATFKPLNYFINNYHPGGIKDYDHNLRIGLKLSSPKNPGK
ncbi:MAG: hypothetical protein WD554_02765 [Flavobacteriaceae bacterium]